jgi:hypothetical protein
MQLQKPAGTEVCEAVAWLTGGKKAEIAGMKRRNSFSHRAHRALGDKLNHKKTNLVDFVVSLFMINRRLFLDFSEPL